MHHESMETVLRAIAGSHRLEIVRLVRSEELTAGQIAAHFEVSRPAISQHLRLLRDAGLITERRQGTRRFYRAQPENLAALLVYLEMLVENAMDDTVVVPPPVGMLLSSRSPRPKELAAEHMNHSRRRSGRSYTRLGTPPDVALSPHSVLPTQAHWLAWAPAGRVGGF